MKPVSRCEISAMELYEQALELSSDSERKALIAGAPVPTAIRLAALELLRNRLEPEARG